MKPKEKIKDTGSAETKFIIDKKLNKLSNKVLFPEKLKKANEVVRKLKLK